MKNKLLLWEIGGFFFIGVVGAALHFTYEFSNFSSNVVAYFSAVNESTWEHLKMVFFPGLVFSLVEYTYVRDKVNNYLIAKTASLFIMPLVIVVGWYIYAPIVGNYIFAVDLSLFYLAVLTGQIISYKLLTRTKLETKYNTIAVGVLSLLIITFSLFTFYPPHIFLFEHLDLKDTGKYGILNMEDNIRYFTTPPQ
ncbi:MAG TPA: hypothetical protein DCX53_11640 [Anaerolineae bacterium]|nr:hypothetical protein [Anaerolineae bacterium]